VDDDTARLPDLQRLDHDAARKAFGIVAAGHRRNAFILGVPEGEAVAGVDVDAHAVSVAAVRRIGGRRARRGHVARKKDRGRQRCGGNDHSAGKSGHREPRW
jgi:hypothetical protein